MITYFLRNTSAKNYENQLIHKAKASDISVIFFGDTVYTMDEGIKIMSTSHTQNT